jgi:uncharacterized repeat protein (TIGR01451 family)
MARISSLGDMLKASPAIRWRMKRAVLAIVVVVLALGAVWANPVPALAANPAPVQIFYVTLPESDALTVLNTVNNDAATPVYTYFSIAIGVSGTYVYYDQWENGYDSDIANPTNLYSSGNLGGTQIWGNSLAADGCPPNKSGVALTCTNANDVLNAGDVIIPYNSIPVPRGASILFDAKDKVGASASIAMARATWATGSGTLNAFAHEMYATSEWGTAYEAPVGCDSASPGTSMFQYSGLSIMAAQNGTPIRVDADGNGTWDYTATLNEGGSYLEGSRSHTGCDYVQQGARVESTDATKPIQVVLVTGDIGSSYESRDMNLLPVSAYGSSYWSPVGTSTGNGGTTSGPTKLWLYNPSANSSIYITCVRRTTSPTTLTQGPVAARGVVTLDLADNEGAHCYASDSNGTATTDKFFGIGTVDSASGDDGQAWDWSWTLYPDNFLTTDALVGLGLGRDPTSSTSPTQNGSPLWVTPVCNTYVYVDWNNDGTPDSVDLNGDGDTSDTVDGISESTSSSGMSIITLKSVRLFRPTPRNDPYDQSGARVWSRTASGVGTGGTPGCNLALAWGQDTRTASAGSPGLDVGTSVPPLRLIEGTKSLTVATDTAPTGVLNPGDTVTYNLTIKNSGSVVVNNVYVYDTVPANTSYVANTTQKDVGSGWTGIPDDGSGTAFPLDVTGGVLLGNLNPGATFYVRFNVTLLTGDYEEISNCDTAYTDAGTFVRCVTTPVATRDWGDLPDSYGTSASANGPRHSNSGLKLGALFDIEAQGVPTTNADGDDLAQSDDEDGVVRSPSGTWGAATNPRGAFNVTVAGGNGCLNAWMDFTNDTGTTVSPDGDFTTTAGGDDTFTGGISEHVIQNAAVSIGSNLVSFPVPNGLLGTGSNSYYFRFRLSPTPCTTTIASTGFVAGGEVEDYKFTFSPTAVTLDSFQAVANPTGDQIDVTWQTAQETENQGFNLWRGASPAEPDVKLNADIIASQVPGGTMGASYQYNDAYQLTPGNSYYYWLEDVSLSGDVTRHEPVSVTYADPTAVRLSGLRAAGSLPLVWPLAGIALLASGAAALIRRRTA